MIQQISFDLGYSSPSAFIALYRRVSGQALNSTAAIDDKWKAERTAFLQLRDTSFERAAGKHETSPLLAPIDETIFERRS